MTTYWFGGRVLAFQWESPQFESRRFPVKVRYYFTIMFNEKKLILQDTLKYTKVLTSLMAQLVEPWSWCADGTQFKSNITHSLSSH